MQKKRKKTDKTDINEKIKQYNYKSNRAEKGKSGKREICIN